MHEWVNRWASVWGLALMALVALGGVVPSSSGAQTTEWRAYGGDVGGTKYSPPSMKYRGGKDRPASMNIRGGYACVKCQSM